MHTVASFMRRLGYEPWAAFQLDNLHWNCMRVQQQVFVSTDCLFRQSGRTTRGLLEYIAENPARPKFVVSSPFGHAASRMLVRRCEDLLEMLEMLEMLEIRDRRVVAGAGGYIDHHKVRWGMGGKSMRALHNINGLVHNWNVYANPAGCVTCLECLAMGPLPLVARTDA